MTLQQQPLPSLADASLSYQPDFLSGEQADQYLLTLRQTLAWQQDQIKLFGRAVAIPRLQCWYGDSGLIYRYSGLSMCARPWSRELEQLRRQIEQHSGYRFNAVLANLYRDGQDSMGWHADNEPELGTNPVIASLSLGQERTFKLRRRDDPKKQFELELQHGSLLVMAGTTQQYWQHALPKRRRLNQPRVNLTFRLIR